MRLPAVRSRTPRARPWETNPVWCVSPVLTSCLGVICNKQEPRDLAGGPFEPGSKGRASHRRGHIEDGAVSHDGATGSRDRPQHDEPSRPFRAPPRVAGKNSRQAHLLVELSQGRLDRCELRLDLHHKKGPCGLVECQDIDRSAFPEVRIGRLDTHHPARSLQPFDESSHERRMPLIDQPIERTAAPPSNELDPRIEAREHQAQCSDRHPVQLTAFDDGDQRLADAGGGCQVGLAPEASSAKSPDRAAELEITHAEMVTPIASRSRISDGTDRPGRPSECWARLLGRNPVEQCGIRLARQHVNE